MEELTKKDISFIFDEVEKHIKDVDWYVDSTNIAFYNNTYTIKVCVKLMRKLKDLYDNAPIE